MSGDADAFMERLKGELRNSIQMSLSTSFKEAVNGVTRKSGMEANLEKILQDVVSSELESFVIPAIESILRSTESRVDAQIRELASQRSSSQAAHSAEVALLESKISELESKLEVLMRVQSSAPVSTTSANPYVTIEQLVQRGEWESAWRQSVSVYNGVDFICHVFHQDKSFSVEDFLSRNPIRDSLLALQVCVNLAQELVQSDKLASLKLELINDVLLGLTNTSGVNLSHQFSQLKTLLSQVQSLAGPSTAISQKIREILKITAATERLLTPANSVVNSPAPSKYF